jgi:hypothetical protein
MSVLIPLLIAAMVAMAIAKAAADAKKGIDESNASAGNAGGGPSPTSGLPGLQGTTADIPTVGGVTNKNAFAPPVGAPGQWTMNPFTVSGGANAGMPGLNMGPDMGPSGTQLPPLQSEMIPPMTMHQPLSLLDQGHLNQVNPFGGAMGQTAPLAMPQPMPSSPPPPPPPPMPQAPPLQAEPPTLGTGIFQGNYPWG